GVRNLEREVASICRKVARKVVEEKPEGKTIITPESIEEYLGPAKFFREVAERTDRSGVAIGLAWTQSGGDILFVESTRMRGKGRLSVTGHLGDVMKESVQAAISYLRSKGSDFGIEGPLFERGDIHANLPALEAALAVAQAERSDLVLHTGDLTGYGPHPNEVIDLVRTRGILGVRGHFDENAAWGIESSGASGDPAEVALADRT